MTDWLKRLAFDHITPTTVVLSLNPAYGNM